MTLRKKLFCEVVLCTYLLNYQQLFKQILIYIFEKMFSSNYLVQYLIAILRPKQFSDYFYKFKYFKVMMR